jgi:hypothetical protein
MYKNRKILTIWTAHDKYKNIVSTTYAVSITYQYILQYLILLVLI